MLKIQPFIAAVSCLLVGAFSSCTAPRPYNPELGNRLEQIERQDPVSPTPTVRKPLDDSDYGYGYYGGPRW
jgi:hypothetical protein